MSEPRLERDSFLQCPQCKQRPYVVWRRQNQQPDGTLLPSFEHVLWPTDVAITPPKDPRRIECPQCGEALRRMGV